MKKRLRYNNKSSSRIPAVADASRRHTAARSGVEVLLYQLLQSALVQKERRNDLPELTPARARELYEAYRRGEMADVQLMWDQLEERDETLFTVLHARLGALAEMPWAVNIDADLAEDMQPLAERQQALANELLAAVENLPEALVHLGMADFRGVAAIEIVKYEGRITKDEFAINGEPEARGTSVNRQSSIDNRKLTSRWEVIEPWNLCRPVRRGPWYYNAEATATPTRPEELDRSAVIIREAQPIDLPAMFLICAKYLSVHAWDAFLEVFGIPNIFLEMPPATPEEKALEFDSIVQRLIGEGRGTIPSGAKFHTVETSKDNTQSFEARAKWCNEAIIQLATGGLLTVTTQSGSGTLAGNAHSDSFARLCAATARSISAAINRQFLRPALQAAFPSQPILVAFELAPEPVDDRLQMAQLIATLASAGYRAKEDDVAELMSMQFTAANMNPTDLYATKAVGYVPTMEAMQTRLGMPLKPAPSENPASVSEPNSQIVNRQSKIVNTCNQYAHDPGCPDADPQPDSLPDDADDTLRAAFADAGSMAAAGYTREQIWHHTGIDYGPTPNGDSPTAADQIRRDRAHERTNPNPRSATARFARRRDAAHKQALEDADIANRSGGLQSAEETSNPAEADSSRRSDEAAEAEPPLSADELAALRALGGEINPAQIAADADYMAREMMAGLREPVANTRSLLDSFLAEGEAAPITNDCTVDNDPERCRCGPSSWKPLTMPDRMDPEEARAELLKGTQVKNPLGEDVTLDRRILEHWEKGDKKARDKEERLAALPLIKQVVAKPAEIWENENGSRTYLASVVDSYKPKGKSYTVAFTQAADNTVLETYFTNTNNAAGKRKGKQLWPKRPADVSGT